MEEKTVQIPKYKTIKNGYTSKTVYIAIDGTEFKTKQDCLAYETELENLKTFENIKKIYHSSNIPDILIFDSGWYYISTEEEIEIIKERFYYPTILNYFNGFLIKSKTEIKLNIGDWISVLYQDGGDYRDTNSIYTLNYVKETLEDFLSLFETERKE